MANNFDFARFGNLFKNSLLLHTSVSVGLTNWKLLYGFVYASFFIALLISLQMKMEPVVMNYEDDDVKDLVQKVDEEDDIKEVEEDEDDEDDEDEVEEGYESEDYSDMPGLIKENEKEE